MPLPQSTGQGLGAFADPDPLPPAPFFERYFLQDPLPAVMFFCLIAIVGWWWLQRVGKARESWIVAAACPLLAGAVLLLAKAVVTEREALVARCQELITATIAARNSEVDRFLRSDATASVTQIGGEFPRQQLLEMIARDEARRRGVTDAGFKWATATLDGPNVARTQCRVQAQWSNTWIPTTWMIYWTRTDRNAPWQVRRIEAQQLGFR